MGHKIQIQNSDTITQHECGLCFKRVEVEDFKRHLHVNHSPIYSVYDQVSQKKIKTVKGKLLMCEICREDFSGKKESFLWMHMESSHLKIKYKCSLCPFETKKKKLLNNH